MGIVIIIAAVLATVSAVFEALWIAQRQRGGDWQPLPHGTLLVLRIMAGVGTIAMLCPQSIREGAALALAFWATFTILHRVVLNYVRAYPVWVIGDTAWYDRTLKDIMLRLPMWAIGPWTPWIIATLLEGSALLLAFFVFP